MIAQTLTIVGLLSALALAVGLCGVWVQAFRARALRDCARWEPRGFRHLQDFEWWIN